MANKKYPYEQMEAEYIASNDLSVRELARRYNVPNASLIHEYARRHKWASLRTARQMRTDEKKVQLLGDRMAEREAKLEDTVDLIIDTINDSLDKLRRDMRENPDSVKVTPRDLALLADRVMVLRGQPSQITEERNLGLSLSGTVGSEQLAAILELTRGVASSDRRGPRGSAIPRLEDPGDN